MNSKRAISVHSASSMSRRQFMLLSGVALAGAGTLAWTFAIEPEWMEITRRALPIRGLPATLAGKTLVQLSDIHVGPSVSDDYVEKVFAQVKALRPDFVAYTGDFTSYHADVYRQTERMYRDLPRGSIGTVGILGNHDYGINWAQPNVAARITDILRAAGVTLLFNESVALGGLQFTGMGDLWAGRFDAPRALASRDPSIPGIVLSHNPDTVDLPGWTGYEGWVLSGHTHGGQCKPPFLPPPVLPVKNKRYSAGAFDLSGRRQMYISRGVGHVMKVRFNVRPEVTVFDLAPA